MNYMSRILHTSDLHFRGKDPKDLAYCKHVWECILETAKEKAVSAILLSGDVFDSFSDLENHRKDFLDCIPEDSPPIYAIAGNHEYLRKPVNSRLSSFDLSPIHWFHEPGFRILPSLDGSWELAVLPYSESYSDYRDWKIPEKRGIRILMAHGMLPEAMIYTGPSEEEGDHVLELDLLKRFEADYTALGHIHRTVAIPSQDPPIHYCGSPGVWRKGELGPRSVNLIHLEGDSGVRVESIPLPQVGEYREIRIPITPGGDIPTDELKRLRSGSFAEQDLVFLSVHGFVDREEDFLRKLENLRREWNPVFRNLEIDSTSMDYMDGISELPLVKKFLHTWEKMYANAPPGKERYILEEARQIGLQSISAKYRAMGGGL